jgi:serine/threonine-protein kinase
MIGQTLGHYRIVEKIGAGGMGVVYRAHDERLDRDVALKVLPAGTLADEAARRRFRKEALALAKLNHPNIGTVYDFDTQEGVDFLVMEFIAGGTLANRVAGGALPEKEVATLGAQIATALEEAHEHAIVHRDLKVGNIAITPKRQAKVLDFGLAKLLQPAPSGVPGESLTESVTEAQVAGTLPYMAPEQLQGERVDARTDIYALGVVLYEMATGRRPFQADSPLRLSDAILHQPPVLPSRLNPNISPALEGIILKCLEKDPGNRYQSAKEVGVDLRRLGVPTSTAVRPVGLARLLQRWAWASLAGVLLVGIGIGLNVGGLRDRFAWGSRPGRIESLAVLPLENLSRDPDQEYFADGVSEALITDLAKIGALKVISRTSAMHYKGTKKTLPEIARELNVDGVIEGSVQRSGDRVRITAQLIYAPTDRHIWAESYERDLRDVLALQNEVALAIANEVRIKVTSQEQIRLASARPVNPEAHEAYLRGRFFWNKRTPEGLQKGLKYFEQALEKDQAYALAYAGIADTYSLLPFYTNLVPKESFAKAEIAALKALQLDDSLAEAHTSLAYLKCYHDWDWAGAEKEYKRALELNPGYATAHLWYSRYLAATGRVNEAVTELKRAQEFDPLSLVLQANAGMIFYCARQYDKSIEELKRTQELDVNFPVSYWGLGLDYEQKGLYEEAVHEFRKAESLSPGSTNTAAALAHAYAVTGMRNEALKTLNQLKERKKHEYVTAYLFALIYAGLGEKNQAMEWLEKAYQEPSTLLGYAKVDPRLDPLRSDPRFQDLLRRVGLPP